MVEVHELFGHSFVKSGKLQPSYQDEDVRGEVPFQLLLQGLCRDTAHGETDDQGSRRRTEGGQNCRCRAFAGAGVTQTLELSGS